MSKRKQYQKMVVNLSPEDKAKHLAAWVTWLKMLIERNEGNPNAIEANRLLEANNL